MLPGFGVKTGLIAKVIVDSRHVCPGSTTDLRHLGVSIAFFGEHLTGCVQQSVAGFLAVFSLGQGISSLSFLVKAEAGIN